MLTHSLVQYGRRIKLRPLAAADFDQWKEVRLRCRDWLTPWEPLPPRGVVDSIENKQVFSTRCALRDRERQLGASYGFGIFLQEQFIGEVNLSIIQRGPFQSAYIGYWIDQNFAGRGYTPEAVVVAFLFAFEELGLHRLEIAIIPRNRASRRVAEKLGLREEGIAVRYLEINGIWEDHIRYAITAEEWYERRDQYIKDWILST